MMKKSILLIAFVTFFFTSKNYSQDTELIFKNLTYINQQFSLYNKYQTLWAVDHKSKEIFCFDKFGSYRAKISEIIIEPKDGSATLLDFKCISGSCLKPSNTSDSKKSSYNMGLSQNLTTVIRKFQEILKEYGNTNSNTNFNNTIKDTSNKYHSGIKESVSQILNRITEIFQTENEYQHKWYVNWNENYIYNKSKSCEVRIPLGKNITIVKTDRGYKFTSTEKNLREKCTSFDNLVDVTYENIKSDSAKDEVIYLFQEILTMTK